MATINALKPHEIQLQSNVLNNLRQNFSSSKQESFDANNLAGAASYLGEYNLAGSMRKFSLLTAYENSDPTPVPVPEAEVPTPTSTATPTATPTATEPASPAATLTFEETKGICDIAYDGEVGEVYQLSDGSYWRVDQVETDDSGFRVVVTRRVVPNPDGSSGYIDDPNDNRVVVGFAGTDAGDDWNDNIAQGIGLTPEQYDQALAFTQKIQAEAAASGETVALTGHSLGGGLATYSSIETGLPATAINSAALDNGKVPDDVSYDGQITQYHTEGEILTDLDKGNPFDSRPGKEVEVDGRYEEESFSDGFDWLDPIGSTIENRLQNIDVSIKNHSLENTAPDVTAPDRVYP